MANGGNAGLLGRLAVHKKLITMEQLVEATAEQGRFGNENKRLGEILIDKGFLTSAQLDELLVLQRSFLTELSSHDDDPGKTPSPAATSPPPATSSSGLFAAPSTAPAAAAVPPSPSSPPSPTTDPRAISLEPSTPTPPVVSSPVASPPAQTPPFATPPAATSPFATPAPSDSPFATPATPPPASRKTIPHPGGSSSGFFAR